MTEALIVLAILAGVAFYVYKRSKEFRENPPLMWKSFSHGEVFSWWFFKE